MKKTLFELIQHYQPQEDHISSNRVFSNQIENDGLLKLAYEELKVEAGEHLSKQALYAAFLCGVSSGEISILSVVNDAFSGTQVYSDSYGQSVMMCLDRADKLTERTITSSLAQMIYHGVLDAIVENERVAVEVGIRRGKMIQASKDVEEGLPY